MLRDIPGELPKHGNSFQNFAVLLGLKKMAGSSPAIFHF